MDGYIFDIKPFAVHDGPGIRTTIFLKGCPLACKWCHNPEGISRERQLAWFAHKCADCLACVKVCPTGAHGESGGRHTLDRSKCRFCGACIQACFAEALRFYGKTISPAEAAEIVLRDKSFYDNSGGGATVSGGEPLLQSEFVFELFSILKENGVHTAVDTAGFVPAVNVDRVLPLTDIFLYDFKQNDGEKHRQGTGLDNTLIKENLRRISEAGKPIEIRIPFVPSYNDNEEDLAAAGDFLKTVKTITKVKVLPYHDFARTKYDSLGMEDTMPRVPLPRDEDLRLAADILRRRGLNAVSGRD
jgi:pyruvate formate lyase activating enzyme